MKIADIELGDRPLFLAPMEDVTDPSFPLYVQSGSVPTWYIPSLSLRTG